MILEVITRRTLVIDGEAVAAFDDHTEPISVEDVPSTLARTAIEDVRQDLRVLRRDPKISRAAGWVCTLLLAPFGQLASYEVGGRTGVVVGLGLLALVGAGGSEVAARITSRHNRPAIDKLTSTLVYLEATFPEVAEDVVVLSSDATNT